MRYPSRHKRPAAARPLALQARDRQLLAAVHRHRYLSAEHVRQLLYPGLRPAQRRLRALWENRYLDRLHVPIRREGGGPCLSPPLYALARRGAEVVASDIDVAWQDLPHTPTQNAQGFATLQHHLIATDLLVAAECCNTDADAAVTTLRESEMVRALIAARARGAWRGQAIVPDGAVQMFPRGNNEPTTYYLEVVRAGVRAGNGALAAKLARYADLHHHGYFRQVFGHQRVRAVLILTTSSERAARFRRLASRLPHGRNLFWFGAYAPPSPGRLAPVVTPAMLRQPMWRTTTGDAISLMSDQ